MPFRANLTFKSNSDKQNMTKHPPVWGRGRNLRTHRSDLHGELEEFFSKIGLKIGPKNESKNMPC